MTKRGHGGRRVPLTLARRLLLPTAEDTLLLRACLWRGNGAAQAFAAWSADAAAALQSLQSAHGARRRLLPLLQAELLRSGAAVPPELQPPLRAAALYEQLRTQAYADIAGEVLRALVAAGITFVATRGVVFAPTLYREAGLRHCHDIDLLLPNGARGEAIAVLAGCGFSLVEGAGDVFLLHTSGLPLMLHRCGVRRGAYGLPRWQKMQGLLQQTPVYGVAAPVLRADLALLQVLLLGPFGPQRSSLVWVCDAFWLVAQGAVEWNALVRQIADGMELLPVLLVLEYLAEALGCAVPAGVLERLRELWKARCAADQEMGRAVLWLSLLQDGAVTREQMWHAASTGREKVLALRTILFPDGGALERMGAIDRTWQAPRYWVRQLGRGARWVLRRASRQPAKSEVGSAAGGTAR